MAQQSYEGQGLQSTADLMPIYEKMKMNNPSSTGMKCSQHNDPLVIAGFLNQNYHHKLFMMLDG